MAIAQTNVTWSSLQTEFGGANPISASEYRRGYYVPYLTTNSAIPDTNSDLAASKWRGAIKRSTYSTADMFQLPLFNGSASDYFYSLDNGESGGISGGWQECWSNTSETITTPNVSYPLKMSVGGYYVTLGNGWRSTPNCFLFFCGSDTYYYDHVSTPGLRLIDGSNTIIGSSDSSDTRDIWYGAYSVQQSVYCPGFEVIVQPNTTYRLKYKANWQLNSGGYNVFNVYTYNRPYITVFNY